jgi:hypothetical protein
MSYFQQITKKYKSIWEGIEKKRLKEKKAFTFKKEDVRKVCPQNCLKMAKKKKRIRTSSPQGV